MSNASFRQALLAPSRLRETLIPSRYMLSRASSTMVPKLARRSFWQSMVPKFLRQPTVDDDPFGTIAAKKAKKAKEWNPATYFIVMFLFVGSMSIQMIALKKDFEAFMRQSDVKIGLLREVVEKLQKGEKVDVERALGTGVPEKELEWEQVLKDIEEGEIKRKQKKKRNTESSEAGPAAPITEPEKTVISTRGQFY
ncbi:hypothetical protein QBC47DRAFT_454464 [Echria macrotheca]|uniref:Uncharacterized protein n=1 Tax=Echria macrotheca TaxID=438768 RepID=A0AAJ0B745_9PEZI|nr:hypothetical protein QBC47DRAFT_454464 [Echria macrotheca]